MMSDYRTALEAAREEVTGAYVKLGPDMYPDQHTLWALISERTAVLAEELTTTEFAAMLGVSTRRARAILASGAVESRKAGAQYLVPRYAVEEYAARERNAGRPKK